MIMTEKEMDEQIEIMESIFDTTPVNKRIEEFWKYVQRLYNLNDYICNQIFGCKKNEVFYKFTSDQIIKSFKDFDNNRNQGNKQEDLFESLIKEKVLRFIVEDNKGVKKVVSEMLESFTCPSPYEDIRTININIKNQDVIDEVKRLREKYNGRIYIVEEERYTYDTFGIKMKNVRGIEK